MYSFCTWIGLLILTTGIFVFCSRIDSIKNGAVTVATVIELKKDLDSETYTPIFRFFTQNKEEVRFEDNVATDPPAWSIGEQVKVAYQKDSPRDVVVLSYFSSFGIAVILMSIALVLLFIAGANYWAKHFFRTLAESK
jgi:hypothetical protein